MTSDTEWRMKPVVEIEWVDSHSAGGWSRPTEASFHEHEETLLCLTTGYLLREGDESVTVVQSLAAVNLAAEFQTIPVCAIRATRVLREADRI